MKFTKIRLSGTNNVDFPMLGTIDFDFGPFICKAVMGLGPPEVDVRIADTVQEGGVYQGRRPRNRQIIMRVGLAPDWDIGQTPEELRTILYDLLTPRSGKMITFKLIDGVTNVGQAVGQISKMEPSYFTKDPEVQITLDCTHPYLMAQNILYQIPTKTIVSGKTELDIQNTGTAPAGFWMGVTFQSPQSAPLILSDDTVDGQFMSLDVDWEAGDTFLVDTRAGQRGVWKVHVGGLDAAKVSILDNLSGDSVWLQLYGGNNTLILNNVAFDWRAEGFGHTPAYWGV